MNTVYKNFMRPRPVLNDEQIEAIMTNANGKLTDRFCTILLHYMMGVLRHTPSVEHARTELFFHISQALEHPEENKQ